MLILTLIAAAIAGHAHLYDHKGRSDGAASHPVTLFVKQDAQMMASCPKFLNEVSNPASKKYGKHWSFDDMKKFASRESFDATLAFLAERGVERSLLKQAPNMEFVTIDATVAEIERIFEVELHDYQHKENAKVLQRRPATPFVAPAALAEHVEVFSGLGELPYHNAKQVPLILSANNQVGASGVATPQVIWSYYGVGSRTLLSKKATQAIFGSLGQDFSPSDLKAYQQANNIPTTPFQHVIGSNDPTQCTMDPNNCIEANLDVQQITATAQGGDNTFWSIPASAQDIFLAWSQAMTASKAPPLVTSISYGSLAPEDPANDKKRFASELCKLGLRGITVIVASGDDGVANFGARNDPTQCGFTPSYPATCPYVTAVGATQGPEVQQTEIMCSSNTGGGITSGGGFSVYYALPDWQADAVNNYLNDPNVDLPPSSAGYDPTMRAYPDVAVMGHNYGIMIGGQMYYGSGTSASAPVFAAMVSLINGMRLSNGKSPLGFLNPALYAMGNSTHYANYFNDITSGTNNCCAGDMNPTCCQYGFEASTGWDPTTGLGSPKFGAFSKYLANL